MLTDILKCLNTIRHDHDKVEIRCIRGRGGAILTGVFDWEHRKEIPAAVAPYSDWAGIYFCLNAPNLPATNKLDHGTAVKDKDISRRVAFMLDFDPVRRGPDGKVLREPVLENGLPVLDNDGKPRMKKMEVSSTAEEKARALQRALACRKYLVDLGWPEPILADSGNGYHLIFYLQMMCINGEDVGVDFDAIYNTLANKFGDDEVEFDVRVKNPSRICKLYGTTPRKGPNTGERPWRQSGLMEGRENWAGHAKAAPWAIFRGLDIGGPCMPGIPTPLSKINPGSAAHNKGRIENRLARYEASKPTGRLGNAPTWMKPEEKKIWKQLARTATSQLGANDRTLMAIAVTLKSKLETHTIAPAELSQLISSLGKLGFIPVDRPAIEKPRAVDPLDRFDI